METKKIAINIKQHQITLTVAMTIPMIARFLALICLIPSSMIAQKIQLTSKMRTQVVVEGITLYMLETLADASIDYIYDNADSRILKGYVAFEENKVFHCIYWNGAYDNLEVIHSFTTSDPEDPSLLRVNNERRPMTTLERKYYDMKMQALTYIRGDAGTFNAPNGMRLQINFVKANDRIKGFVMPYTSQDSLIPLGNDFIINFTRSGELIDYDVIHTDFQEIDATKSKFDEDGSWKTVQSLKNNQVPHISPTEICNLLLYSPFPDKHEHYVISDQYVSIFSLKKRSLDIKPI